ncbi:alpha/beta hydrolase [Parabacteroides sp. Marseille-P3160]|uniref:alpha/beta hydrolase n=1 Tax=Parabacteroides sp. Marseille-P3160 TaxID=1917887 RepID=UPI00190E765A|nr:alpha/beta hydrolase [Parabacteroides sp. Marseille-P3160]
MKKTRIVSISLIILLMSITMNAQKVIKIWEGNPPTDNGITTPEKTDATYWITSVTSPELTIYLPEKGKANGKGVVICPGGGYAGLASNHEGTQLAQWLNTQGIAGFVLKYRMPNKHKEVPLDDAQQAIRYVREHAGELGVNPNQIGIAGSSAGGHLAATASTHFSTTGTSTRPDFSILFYPVITMERATHGGSKANLLGDKPTEEDIYTFSNEKQVNVNTPPAILLLSDDDKTVPPVNSTLYYEALKANNIPATLYVFPEGGHGWGMKEDFKYHKQMLELLSTWLKKF